MHYSNEEKSNLTSKRNFHVSVSGHNSRDEVGARALPLRNETGYWCIALFRRIRFHETIARRPSARDLVWTLNPGGSPE